MTRRTDPPPTAHRISELYAYEPDTGLFRHKRSNRRAVAGQVAGHVNPRGYRQLSIDGRLFYGHNLAWFIMTGDWPSPDQEVDHRHSTSAGDVWENLRLATRSQQTLNGKMRSDNTSGVRGVRLEKSSGRWIAELVMNGKYVLKARFASKEDAAAARRSAEQKFCPAFVRPPV